MNEPWGKHFEVGWPYLVPVEHRVEKKPIISSRRWHLSPTTYDVVMYYVASYARKG